MLALVNYATVITKDDDKSTLGQLSFVASTSELWKLPHGSVGLAIGADFRREQLEQDPDALSLSGDLVGESPTSTTNAQRKIGGVFAEARVPLLRNVEGSVSVRHEKFFTSHRDTTPCRSSRAAHPAAREPTHVAHELFERLSRTVALRALLLAAFGAAADPSIRAMGSWNRSSPSRFAATADSRRRRRIISTSASCGRRPSGWLKGLSLGVNHWEISRNGTVEANPQNTVYRFFGALPGGLLPGESVLLTSSGFISSVNSLFYNVGRTEVGGWDFSGGYQLPTDALGRWELTTVWTIINKFNRAAFEGASMVSVKGKDATGTGDYGYLQWRGRVNLNWAYQASTRVSISGLYTDGFEDHDVNGDPFQVEATLIVDGQVSYSLSRNTRGPWLRDTKFTVGLRNLLDRDSAAGDWRRRNTNGYPGFLYTSENRFWYVSMSRKF